MNKRELVRWLRDEKSSAIQKLIKEKEEYIKKVRLDYTKSDKFLNFVNSVENRFENILKEIQEDIETTFSKEISSKELRYHKVISNKYKTSDDFYSEIHYVTRSLSPSIENLNIPRLLEFHIHPNINNVINKYDNDISKIKTNFENLIIIVENSKNAKEAKEILDSYNINYPKSDISKDDSELEKIDLDMDLLKKYL